MNVRTDYDSETFAGDDLDLPVVQYERLFPQAGLADRAAITCSR